MRRRLASLTVVVLASLIAGCGGESVSTGPLLAPPPSGEGFQLTTGDFEVPAGNDVQACYFFKVKDIAERFGYRGDEPLILRRTEIAYKVGSHHMNIFRVRTILDLDPANGDVQVSMNGTGPCSFTQNWSDWPLIANNQEAGYFDWEYPEGVGNELLPDETIMLQSHYVNTTSQTTPNGGRADVNLWTMPKSELKYPLGTLFATKQSIRICQSNPTPKFSGSCQINSPEPVRIIGANGHFHTRGKEFGMYLWDGKTPETPPESARFYTSLVWDEPPMLTSPELNVEVPPFGGLWYTCSYEWAPPKPSVGCAGLNKLDKEGELMTPDEALDCCYTFGNTVDSAPHCNNFVYYYPKQDDVNCY